MIITGVGETGRIRESHNGKSLWRLQGALCLREASRQEPDAPIGTYMTRHCRKYDIIQNWG